MVCRIAINGYGRIGRCVLRALYERGYREQLQVVAINEIADLATVSYLTKYDSNHGRFPCEVETFDHGLRIQNDEIALLNQPDIAYLDWRSIDVDIVFECTGVIATRAQAQQHIERGASRVLFSHPADPKVDQTIVYGFNEQTISDEARILSAASCTTNSVVPVIEALHNTVGVERGVITTLHSTMNDQPVTDAYHHTDLRKTRSSSQSIIPVDTQLAKGIDRLMPELAGRFEAQALRIPTVNVSAIDLSVVVGRNTSIEEVNQILQRSATQSLENIMGYTEEPLASCDFNHDSRSSIIDASQTKVAGQRLVKVLMWFDNEWGYANRMLDVAKMWSRLRS